MARTKPRTPEQIRADKAERRLAEKLKEHGRALRNDPDWGVAEDTVRQPDVDVSSNSRERVAGAHRTDVFERLYTRKSITRASFESVRRLARDMAERRGEGDKPLLVTGGPVDPEALPAKRRRMILAGIRVDEALAQVGGVNARLLSELIEPTFIVGPALGMWRIIVARLTSVKDRDKQGDVVKDACVALTDAYRALDNRPRRVA